MEAKPKGLSLDFRSALILASASPRRRQILEALGLRFAVVPSHADETVPGGVALSEAAAHIALRKARFIAPGARPVAVLAADTMVLLGDLSLAKPADRNEAIEMLTALSGRTHHVVTGVALVEQAKQLTFSETTRVTFKALDNYEIERYVDLCAPMDKAGAYGIQEVIPPGTDLCTPQEQAFIRKYDLNLGSITEGTQRDFRPFDMVSRIEGSFFNVVGLPVQRLCEELARF